MSNYPVSDLPGGPASGVMWIPQIISLFEDFFDSNETVPWTPAEIYDQVLRRQQEMEGLGTWNPTSDPGLAEATAALYDPQLIEGIINDAEAWEQWQGASTALPETVIPTGNDSRPTEAVGIPGTVLGQDGNPLPDQGLGGPEGDPTENVNGTDSGEQDDDSESGGNTPWWMLLLGLLGLNNNDDGGFNLGLGNTLQDVLGSFIGSGLEEALGIDPISNYEDFLNRIFPDTNQWDRLRGNSGASSAAGQRSQLPVQERMQIRELETRKEVARINAGATTGAATIGIGPSSERVSAQNIRDLAEAFRARTGNPLTLGSNIIREIWEGRRNPDTMQENQLYELIQSGEFNPGAGADPYQQGPNSMHDPNQSLRIDDSRLTQEREKTSKIFMKQLQKDPANTREWSRGFTIR